MGADQGGEIARDRKSKDLAANKREWTRIKTILPQISADGR
jgi:hypothetical protein